MNSEQNENVVGHFTLLVKEFPTIQSIICNDSKNTILFCAIFTLFFLRVCVKPFSIPQNKYMCIQLQY